MFETLKKKIGGAAVKTAADAAKEKIEENKEDILATVFTAAILATAVIGMVRLVTPPRAAVSKIHLYIHID